MEIHSFFFEKSDENPLKRPSLPFPVYRSASCIINHNIFIFGGRNVKLKSTKYIQQFNTQTNQWNVIQHTNISSDRYGHQCCVVGGMIFVIGGYSNSTNKNL